MLTIILFIAVAIICYKIGIYAVLFWAFSIALKLSLALLLTSGRKYAGILN